MGVVRKPSNCAHVDDGNPIVGILGDGGACAAQGAWVLDHTRGYCGLFLGDAQGCVALEQRGEVDGGALVRFVEDGVCQAVMMERERERVCLCVCAVFNTHKQE